MEATLPQACPSSTGVLAMLRRALSGNPCAAYKRSLWRDEANERLLFHGTGATKPLARRARRRWWGARARTRQPVCEGRDRQAIDLADRAAYRRSGRRSSPQGRSPAGRSVDLIAKPGARIYRPVRAAGRVGAEAEWFAEHVCAHRLQVRTPLGDTRQARAAGGGARGYMRQSPEAETFGVSSASDGRCC